MLHFEDYDVKLGAKDPVNLDTAEHQLMRLLKWARHFCQIIDIDRDPLNQKWPHLLPHHNESHLYMEWIPNGTLRNFVDQVKAAEEIKFLPNRLLWRFFLCLIRSNIGLQWPPGKPPGGAPVLENVGTEANRRTILHQDIHMSNIMVDDFHPNVDREHDIFPALKMIDLGSAEEVDANTEVNNLRSLGEVRKTTHLDESAE
ncbi:hypothetical protein BJ166DRAFT_157752 [Pestalotiopsis sp. NC0098]|nr:hypothetical protein BJ166DRAFT_157752 [Pestalotiopsis sp. NC0098]